MDMRNFDLSEHPGKYKRWSYFFSAGICIDWVSCSEINIIPYRPKSGKNRGMKNTFLFTMDNIQVIVRIIQDQSKSLWSRSRKPTTSCSTPRSFPHPGSKSPCGAGAFFYWTRCLLLKLCWSKNLPRVQIKMWAVVRIQRCFKAFLKRKAQQRESKKKVSSLMKSWDGDGVFYQRADTKERWKKHIEGDDYVPSPPSASSINRSGGTLLTM